MSKLDRIVIFDFDSTLVNTMGQEDGERIWLEKTGKKYPHIGWWAKEESLDTVIFEHPLNDQVFQEYIKYIHMKKTSVHLVTGRLQKMKPKVMDIVDQHKLSFDGIHCNNIGKDTFTFKIRLFEKLISDNPSIKEFIMFDDRIEHISKFKEWMLGVNTNVTIHDVINNQSHHNFVK